MKTPDLTYKDNGLFVQFMPETSAGESAWRAIANETDGTGNILCIHARGVIAQLRNAGYTVHKYKPAKANISNNELLAALS